MYDQLPGLLTRIIPAIVSPRNAFERDESLRRDVRSRPTPPGEQRLRRDPDASFTLCRAPVDPGHGAAPDGLEERTGGERTRREEGTQGLEARRGVDGAEGLEGAACPPRAAAPAQPGADRRPGRRPRAARSAPHRRGEGSTAPDDRPPGIPPPCAPRPAPPRYPASGPGPTCGPSLDTSPAAVRRVGPRRDDHDPPRRVGCQGRHGPGRSGSFRTATHLGRRLVPSEPPTASPRQDRAEERGAAARTVHVTRSGTV